MSKLKKILVIIGISIMCLLSISCVLYGYISNNKIKNIKVHDENIVFFGDSITYGYNVKEFFEKYHVVNSGINGNQTRDLLDRIETDLYDYNPSKVILLIGTNDIRSDINDKDIINNIKSIIKGIRTNRKNAEIYIQSVYPLNRNVDEAYWRDVNENYNNSSIIELNKRIKKLCSEEHIKYINVYDKLLDKDGNLKSAYTKEGLHLNDLGYYKVTNVLKKYLSK